MSYFVYILECSDGTYYTGSSNDIEKRVSNHNTSSSAAKYTRMRRPVRLVYSEECTDKGVALSREHSIKKLSRTEKKKLINRK